MAEREMKWIYEIIVESIPPFSWLPRRYNILLQLLVMEVIGILVGIYYNLGLRVILYGTLAVSAVILWSLVLLEIAPTIRKFRFSLSEDENRLIGQYKGMLFHPHRYGSIPGLLIFLGIMVYLFPLRGLASSPYGYDLLSDWFRGLGYSPEEDFVLLVLVAGLCWDISYRMGLGIYVSLLSLWRSAKLERLSRERERLEYTPYTEVSYLKRLDLYTLSIGLIAFLLAPVVHPNRLLFYAFLGYTTLVVLASLLSIRLLSAVPWLPPDIYELVENGKFAYLGCSNSRMEPHVTSIIYVFSGRSIYFVTSVASKKLKNLRENPKMAFLIDVRDPEDIFKNKAVLFRGEAKIFGLKDLPFGFLRMYEARRLFFQKYPEYVKMYSDKKAELPRAWQMTPIISRILIEVKPKDILYWRTAKQIRLPM